MAQIGVPDDDAQVPRLDAGYRLAAVHTPALRAVLAVGLLEADVLARLRRREVVDALGVPGSFCRLGGLAAVALPARAVCRCAQLPQWPLVVASVCTRQRGGTPRTASARRARR